uniref:Uncharacterized protein n=1 Tax=Thermosporothrix sp. COM3 TaxID=2490863 RepID=A0A455SZW8_9CHLR|nr:hypothetical protein KTC_64360 [Thermosporothrix sp. COM3]
MSLLHAPARQPYRRMKHQRSRPGQKTLWVSPIERRKLIKGEANILGKVGDNAVIERLPIVGHLWLD